MFDNLTQTLLSRVGGPPVGGPPMASPMAPPPPIPAQPSNGLWAQVAQRNQQKGPQGPSQGPQVPNQG